MDAYEEKELQAHAEIGHEGQRFLHSDLGKTMLGMAAQELDAALDDFEKADVTDMKKILEIQNKVRFARRFPGWIHELIADGEEAISVWSAKKAEERG